MGLPWHVAFVPNRRALLTASGIALAVAFTVLSFSVGAALEGSTIELGEHLRRGEVAIRKDDLAPFRPEALGIDAIEFSVLLVDVITVQDEALRLAAVEGNASNVPPGTFGVAPGYDRFPAAIEIRGPRALVLVKGDATGDALALRSWPRIAPEDARRLDPTLADGRASYVIARDVAPTEVARLAEEGYHVDAAPAADPFFATSSREVARSLILVVVVSSVLAGLFAYEFFRSEIREKRREIALWRAVGMRARDVLALLLARALALGALGTAAGASVAFGALSLAAAGTSIDLFTPTLGLGATAGLLGAFLLAAVAGSLVPAIGASRTNIAVAMGDAA